MGVGAALSMARKRFRPPKDQSLSEFGATPAPSAGCGKWHRSGNLIPNSDGSRFVAGRAGRGGRLHSVGPGTGAGSTNDASVTAKVDPAVAAPAASASCSARTRTLPLLPGSARRRNALMSRSDSHDRASGTRSSFIVMYSIAIATPAAPASSNLLDARSRNEVLAARDPAGTSKVSSTTMSRCSSRPASQ
ncbi:hypothetical protein ACVIU7_002729 [Bradyrhizobium liaoningense]